MVKTSPSGIAVAVFISWCAGSAVLGQSGNTSAHEYGDPVYRELDLFGLGLDDHSALFAGLSSSGTPRIIHVQNTSYVVINDDLSNMTDYPGRPYWGAYNLDYLTLSFEARKDIVSTAIDLIGRDIDYPWAASDCLNRRAGTTGSIYPSDITELRCDGLVEYCYEYNGLDVWGRNGQRYDIAYGQCADGDPYCGEHNNLYDHIWPNNPDEELSPRVQRGALGGTSTHMTYAASVAPPTYVVEQTVEPGVTRVTVTATDVSGIHYIKYKVSGEADWHSSPVQPQHPTWYSYSYTVPVYESTWLYFYAKDNAGNYPAYAESVWVTVESCGDGSCNGDENCSTCPADCLWGCGDGCCSGAEDACTCSADGCVPYCGDGCCNGGENACTCPGDGCSPYCGDGCCNGGENACTCQSDGCNPYCGDGCCNGTENACTCPGDGCSAYCGDGCCNGSDNACNCPEDGCPSVCGDGCCDPSETCESCPSDCQSGGSCCGDGVCGSGEDACNCPQDCPTTACGDGCCNGSETPCTCTEDVCPSVCGDSCCDPSETCDSCPADCDTGGACCGDGVCDPVEDCSTCRQDCEPSCGDNVCECDEPVTCPNDCDGIECVLYDMNGDGHPSIGGDVEAFVRVVYFDDYDWYEQQFPGRDPVCAGDCNCDGHLSIGGDVACFVACVYFQTCGDCGRSSVAPDRVPGPNDAERFLVGGAVYADSENRLLSGVAGVRVELVGLGGTVASYATTTIGPTGAWSIENVLEGSYKVIVCSTDGSGVDRKEAREIYVNAENLSVNESISVQLSPGPLQERGRARTKVR